MQPVFCCHQGRTFNNTLMLWRLTPGCPAACPWRCPAASSRLLSCSWPCISVKSTIKDVVSIRGRKSNNNPSLTQQRAADMDLNLIIIEPTTNCSFTGSESEFQKQCFYVILSLIYSTSPSIRQILQ